MILVWSGKNLEAELNTCQVKMRGLYVKKRGVICQDRTRFYPRFVFWDLTFEAGQEGVIALRDFSFLSYNLWTHREEVELDIEHVTYGKHIARGTAVCCTLVSLLSVVTSRYLVKV